MRSCWKPYGFSAEKYKFQVSIKSRTVLTKSTTPSRCSIRAVAPKTPRGVINSKNCELFSVLPQQTEFEKLSRGQVCCSNVISDLLKTMGKKTVFLDVQALPRKKKLKLLLKFSGREQGTNVLLAGQELFLCFQGQQLLEGTDWKVENPTRAAR